MRTLIFLFILSATELVNAQKMSHVDLRSKTYPNHLPTHDEKVIKYYPENLNYRSPSRVLGPQLTSKSNQGSPYNQYSKGIADTNSSLKDPAHLLETYTKTSSDDVLMVKYECTYDLRGEKTGYILYLQGEDPENDAIFYEKVIQEYDDNGNQTFYESFYWSEDANEWIPSHRQEWTYYDEFSYLNASSYQWDEINKVWKGSSNTEYEYTDDGLLENKKSYAWDAESDTWVKSDLQENVYDSENKIIKILFYTFELSEWSLQSKDELFYDSNGDELRKISLKWQSDGEWINSSKYEYVNKNGLQTESEFFYWNEEDNDWQLSSEKTVFEYDDLGNMTSIIGFSRNVTTNEWIEQNRYVEEYDQKGRRIAQASYYWDASRNDWKGLGTKSVSAFDDSGNLTKAERLGWNDTMWGWSGYNLNEFEFDETGVRISHTHSKSTVDTDIYTPEYKVWYYYNKFEKRKYGLSYYWNSELSDWNESFDERLDYTYLIIKGEQEITFDNFEDINILEETLSLTATVNSGLELTYTSSDEDVATVDGSLLNLVGVGTTTIEASQAGNEEYEVAESVTQELTVFMVTSVDNGQEDQLYLVAPNPVFNTFSIKSAKEQVQQVNIYDMQGRMLRSFNRPYQSYNVSQLVPGIYNLVVLFNEGAVSSKFIKN